MDANLAIMWLKGLVESGINVAGPDTWGRVREVVLSAELVDPAPTKIVEVYRPPVLDKSRLEQELSS